MNEKNGFFKRRKKGLIVFAVILFIGLIVLLNLNSKREKSVKVTIEKVNKQDLTSLISASGEVKPKKNVNISAQVPGRIIKIGVKEGDEVRAGDFLLKLDSSQYEANAERDRAAIQSFNEDLIQADARLKRDRSFYERQKKLSDESLISKDQFENAKLQYDISTAQYNAIRHQIEQAQASLKSSVDNLNKTTYTSPIDGIITSLRIEEGEIALIGTMNNPGTVLMTIADLSVMEVEVEVDETDVVGVQLGQTARIRVDAYPDLVFKGIVTEIGSSALQKLTASSTTEEAKDFKVVVTLENPPKKLKPGLSASADIITSEKKGIIAVPISALILREKEGQNASALNKKEEEGVYAIENGRARFRPVTKGITGEMLIEIISGLAENNEIVTGPYSALRELKDGTLVKPEEKKAGEK